MSVVSPNQAGVYAVSAILMFASAGAVALRFLARRIKQVGWKSDDWLALISMLFVWGLALILIVGMLRAIFMLFPISYFQGAARSTLGAHTEQDPATGATIVTPHENDASMLAGISQLLTIVVLGTLKSSVTLLYRRIFIGRPFQIASLCLLVVIVLWAVSFFFATLFECGRDFSLLWQSLLTFKNFCENYKYIQLGHAASDIATDVILLSLPLPIIWGLHLAVRRKIELSCIFLLGLLSTAAGTARLVVVAEDLYETTTGSRDVRGVETNAMVWTFVEVGVGTIAACLPTLKPIFDSRTPESIVNSVRSKLSINSQGSPTRRKAKSDSSILKSDSYEMLAMDRSKSNSARKFGVHIEGGDSIHQNPAVPGNGILVENGLSVREERASIRT